jgi:3',5'-cyclic AMP phosphodiesterase CpdA
MGAADAEQFFTMAPPSNTTRKIRIAAFGDCGRASSTYQDENLANYRSFLAANSIDAPDAWILMGDNAYLYGLDAEYTTNFFGVYGSSILKNHKLYPAPGNHDYANNTANRTSRAMDYYQNFSTPQSAECGGVASGKPNFYSFDIGNIHFLSLDAWGIESDGTHMGTAGASMLKTWINNDLAANTKKWTIAYWHHSPYTKSSHNSDTEPELGDIRQNFIGYLKTRGVDMIICGHSHAYERSYLLRNYTSSWAAFNAPVHAVNNSSATYTSNTTCP